MHATHSPETCHIIVAGEPHMPLSEVLRRLNIHRRTAYRWFEAGRLSHHKHLGRIYCPTDQVVRIQVEREAAQRNAGGTQGPTPPPRPTNPPDGSPKDGA